MIQKINKKIQELFIIIFQFNTFIF